MKRLLYTTLFCSLTVLLVSKPPRVAEGQPFRTPPKAQDTMPRRTPDTGDAGITQQIDSINRKAALLNRKTGEIRQGSVELEKATKKLLQEVRKDRDTTRAVSAKTPDTVQVKDTTCVFVHDNSMDGKGWWYQYRILLKKCNIKQKVGKLFKRKK